MSNPSPSFQICSDCLYFDPNSILYGQSCGLSPEFCHAERVSLIPPSERSYFSSHDQDEAFYGCWDFAAMLPVCRSCMSFVYGDVCRNAGIVPSENSVPSRCPIILRFHENMLNILDDEEYWELELS